MFRILILLGGLTFICSQEVLPGIDVLEQRKFQGLIGKKVGLVTNPSGVSRDGRSTIDILFKQKTFTLVSLFGPEHGVYGKVPAGKYVPSFRDSRTGLWVHSLYGETRAPTPKMLRGIDVIVYDMQDIGCRSYTYISTLGLVMQEAQKLNIEVMVLDRPNPMGGNRIEGPRLNPQFKSFIGQYDIPYVYGLTVGELAKWINDRFLKKPCRLTVIPMKNWYREMVWEETGLKWVSTSPNIPNIESARGYLATSILGDVGIHSGVGEKFPFLIAAREGIDGNSMARRLNRHGVEGVKAEPIRFRSSHKKWSHITYSGVYLRIQPEGKGSLTGYGFHLLDAIRAEASQWRGVSRAPAEKRQLFDKLNGSDIPRKLFLSGGNSSQIQSKWTVGLTQWKEERKPYLMYDSVMPSPELKIESIPSAESSQVIKKLNPAEEKSTELEMKKQKDLPNL